MSNLSFCSKSAKGATFHRDKKPVTRQCSQAMRDPTLVFFSPPLLPPPPPLPPPQIYTHETLQQQHWPDIPRTHQALCDPASGPLPLLGQSQLSTQFASQLPFGFSSNSVFPVKSSPTTLFKIVNTNLPLLLSSHFCSLEPTWPFHFLGHLLTHHVVCWFAAFTFYCQSPIWT